MLEQQAQLLYVHVNFIRTTSLLGRLSRHLTVKCMVPLIWFVNDWPLFLSFSIFLRWGPQQSWLLLRTIHLGKLNCVSSYSKQPRHLIALFKCLYKLNNCGIKYIYNKLFWYNYFWRIVNKLSKTKFYNLERIVYKIIF